MRFDVVVLLFALALGACSDEPKMATLPASEAVLSQYQTIHIGSQKFTLPTIALLSSTTDSNLILSDSTRVSIENVLSQRTHGTSVARMDFSIHAYRQLQDYRLDTHAYVSNAFCERLMARWEKNECFLRLYDGKNAFTPQHFQVVDVGYLIGSGDKLFGISGSGPVSGDAARALLTRNVGEQIMCAQGQQPLCTAVMPIGSDLVAVWATRREELEADKKRINWLINQYR